MVAPLDYHKIFARYPAVLDAMIAAQKRGFVNADHNEHEFLVPCPFCAKMRERADMPSFNGIIITYICKGCFIEKGRREALVIPHQERVKHDWRSVSTSTAGEKTTGRK